LFRPAYFGALPWIASNIAPVIGSENADQSRLGLIEVGPSKNTDDPAWPKRLEAELPAFLWACRQKYEALCPNHGKIRFSRASDDLKRDIAAQYEEEYASVFEQYFLPVKGSETPAGTVHHILTDAGFRDNQRSGDFKRWMERTHEVVFRNSNGKRRYENLQVHPNYERFAERVMQAGEGVLG